MSLPALPSTIDAYTGEDVTAERTTVHEPSEFCLWVARHPVAVCGYIRHPGIPVGEGQRSVRKRVAPTAAELQEVPKALARPEPAAPWELARVFGPPAR